MTGQRLECHLPVQAAKRQHDNRTLIAKDTEGS